MRTNILFSLKCSICGNDLEVDDNPKWKHRKNDDSEKGVHTFASSAYEMGVVFKIKPCPYCIDQLTKPAQMIKEGLEALNGRESAKEVSK